MPIKATAIRIPDLDAPIHRIFSLWSLERTLQYRALRFVRPKEWEDPYEIVGDAIQVTRKIGDSYDQTVINQNLPPAYAQCWSATGESDTLLRAYSRVLKHPQFNRNVFPQDEGVRVRSTPRKLLKAIADGILPPTTGSAFLGAVRYGTEKQIFGAMREAIRRGGLTVFANPQERAELLLLKRNAFAHEREVRALFVLEPGDGFSAWLDVRCDPNVVFDEITFDPRLGTDEKRERSDLIRRLGYTGPIGESELYQRILLDLWLDPPPAISEP